MKYIFYSLLTGLFIFLSQIGFAQQSQFIEENDGLIHFRVFGDGVPVLIINGGPGMNSDGFSGLAETLGESYKAIIYDQRGTGKSQLSEINSRSITLDLMVKDIEAIRKELNIEEWAIVGHSFGGILASYYTSKHPTRVSGLILSSSGGLDMSLFSSLNITGRLTSLQRDSLNYWTRKIQNGDTTYFASLQRGKYLAPAYLNDKSYVPNVAERLTQGNSEINALVYQDMRRIGYDVTEDLKGFENPVLIMQGKHDIIPVAISEKAHSVFKHSKLLILPNSSHYGWLEDSLLYFAEIDSLISLTQN
ncbi:MAG: alpha/beta hydrolase [Balneola sp.]